MTTDGDDIHVQHLFPDKLVISAAECNKQPIVDTLLDTIIPSSTPVSILEIASGTGQHIVHFAAHFPLANFQPSDCDPKYLKSIQAYIDEYEVDAFTKNVAAPISIDLLSPAPIDDESFDFVYCSNLIHITPIECTQGLFKLAGRVLKPGGGLITYGAYALPGDGRITPESNRRFHAHLQMQDSRWGLKGIDELKAIAKHHQLELKETFDMPMNNKILWWNKRQDL